MIFHDIAETDGSKAAGISKSSSVIRMDPAIVELTSPSGLRTPSGLVSSYMLVDMCQCGLKKFPYNLVCRLWIKKE